LAQELGNQADALIFALGAPETNGSTVLVLSHACSLHERTNTLPSDLIPQMKLLDWSLIFNPVVLKGYLNLFVDVDSVDLALFLVVLHEEFARDIVSLTVCTCLCCFLWWHYISLK